MPDGDSLPAADPAVAEIRVDGDQSPGTLPEEVRSLYAFLPAARIGFLAGVGLVTLTFWSRAPAQLLLPWLAAFGVMGIARLVVEWRYRRATPRNRRDWLRWRFRFNLGTVLAGALMGLTG
ncbi:MAG: hypothetical protein OEY03_12705, partial [Rhizobacter sp.]|nr:hypothetical protein [Rhizobacter sp.]